MEMENETVFLVLVYRPPGLIGTFVYDLIQEISMLSMDLLSYGEYRTLIVGDFNLDQMLNENVSEFESLCTYFNCVQRSGYSTHILGGILDLVFDNKRSEPVEWMPSPFSDHFIILIDIWFNLSNMYFKVKIDFSNWKMESFYGISFKLQIKYNIDLLK